MRKTMRILSVFLASVLLQACSSDSSSFSILPSGQSFQQSTSFTSTKIDILWVVDNSGSMASSQQNLVANFNSFIKNFVQKSYDFRMAVTTSDAFMAEAPWASYYNDPWNNYYYRSRYYFDEPQANKAMLRDGVPGTSSSGIRIIDNKTADIIGTFNTNSLQGITGYGDERAFQSITSTLNSALNSGFRRDDAFLAIIIVSDEDDFSYDGTTPIDDPTHSSLHPVSQYVDYLNAFTESSGATRRYSVSTISINDQACLDLLNQTTSGRKIGLRMHDIVNQTGGTIGNLCGDFSEELNLIQDKIINKLTAFYLQRTPVPSTIHVVVNGAVVPDAAKSSDGQGWTYVAEANAIQFSERYAPPQGAAISVNFDPAGLDF